MAQTVKNPPARQETHVQFLGQQNSLEKGMAPVFLPGAFHEQRSLAGYSPCSHKESDMTERLNTPIPVFLPGEFHEQRSLAGYSPWGCKESDTPE